MDYSKPFQSNFPYFVITPPVALPVTLAHVKEHLRLDPDDDTQNTYLTLLINAAAGFCEEYTRRTLINTGFRTFRNFFAGTIELLRSPLVSLDAFEYSVDGSFVAVDSNFYYMIQEIDYSKIILRNSVYYPTDGDDILQMIRIEFTAGYGTASTDIPSKLYLAILNHIAALYENHGDCDVDSVNFEMQLMNNLPVTSRMIYNNFKIHNLI